MKTASYFLLLLLPLTGMAQDYLKQFPLHQETKYFDFHFKKDSEKVKAIALFADGFVDIINRDFFKAEFAYPIRVLVLEDRATFKAFLNQQFEIKEPPNFGIYLYQYKLFATYEDSGLGTFAHEIMHPLVESNLGDRPIWAIEGIPTFFEKFYGYWQDNKMVIYWGYQNPWRIEALGTNLMGIKLENILNAVDSPGKYNESDLRMVSMFLWEQGKFKKFLLLIKQRQKNGYNSYFEAAMEMPIKQAIPLWQGYLSDVAAKHRAIMKLPVSSILEDEAEFQKFSLANGIILNNRP